MNTYIHFHGFFLRWELQVIHQDDSIESIGLFSSREAAEFFAQYNLDPLHMNSLARPPPSAPRAGSITKYDDIVWMAVGPCEPGQQREELKGFAPTE